MRAIGSLGAIGLGAVASGMLGLLAYVLAPEVGLFGDRNDTVERALGATFASATGPALLAGPLLRAWSRRDRSTLVPLLLVAAAVSAVVSAVVFSAAR